MNNKRSKKEIVLGIEKHLRINIVKIESSPQGMDSEVFFAKDILGNEYAIKHGKGVANDIFVHRLIEENKIDIPIPELFGTFIFENESVAILEKIKFPLLESVPVNEMHRYIPSMIGNLKKIHKVKADRAGFLVDHDKKCNWREIMLSKFNGANPDHDWKNIAARKGLDTRLIMRSVEKIIEKIERADFAFNSYSLLHTDFNQKNLFVVPDSAEIASIIDWGEAMFGDPIYDFARVRMYIWHFNLQNNVLETYDKLLSLTPEQRKLEELYWVSRVIEYLAYYSEDLNGFNLARIKLHEGFLKEYRWRK